MRTGPWIVLAVLTAAGCDEASVRLALDNQTSTRAPRAGLLADGTSLRLKMLAVYLAEDVDPVTQDNAGNVEMVWLNPQCGGDVSRCNIDGFAEPAGPRVTSYFDLARPTAEVNAELSSQGAAVTPGSYQYVRVEMCKASGQTQPTAPTMMWSGPGMTTEQPFSSGDCGRTSLRFDPPLDLAAGDSVEVSLGYDLDKAIVSGAPAPGGFSIAGIDHTFRACVNVDAASRVCMDFPDFAPSAISVK